MSKFIRFFAYIILIALLITSPVLAIDNVTTISKQDVMPIAEEESNILPSSNIINSDLFINESTDYTLDSILYGNAFISANNLTINSRNNGGVIFGDLFASTTNTTISSDLVYSNSKDKIGNYLIENVNSASIVNGNVFVMASDTFTLESKSEIHGDLYVFANVVNIEPDAVVQGNIFAFANSTLNLNGKVSGSVYAIANTYNMNYTGYISKDLSLTAENANISGKIDRNTKITSENGNIVTKSDFITAKDLIVEATNFEFAGEVQGNAKISSKNLTFNNSENVCIIRGNLEYATQSNLTIPEGIVLGQSTSREYIDKNSFSYVLLSKLISYVSLLLYVFVVALLFKKIAPNYIEKISNISSVNILYSLGIGFICLLLILPALLLLLLTNFTILLAMVLLLAFLFISSIAIPLFILAIANTWKSEKINFYLRMLIITSIVFIISLIPSVGSYAILLFTITSVGKILIALFKKA